ncbi:MAG: hypothetical protein ACOC41_01925 [Chitinivibrionales bacterium]
MEHQFLLMTIVNVLILAFGVSLGRSVLFVRMRKEENRKRELELKLLEKRAEVVDEGRQMTENLEELLYQAQVQQEINEMIRKKDGN